MNAVALLSSPLGSFTPILAISIGSLGYLVTGRFFERTRSAAILAVLLVAVAVVLLAQIPDTIVDGEYGIIVDDLSRLLGILACGGALLSLIGTSSAINSEQIETVNEYYFLTLTALCGALVMIFAADFLTLFIGVEVASLALYCLCGARITKPASSEASIKYFLLGCFSSAFLLYGIALWYGATGSLSMMTGSDLIVSPMVILSFLMILLGLGFKLGLAPFHLWVPDVYQGAPTSVTTFMSCVVKIAAFAALLKVSYWAFEYPQEWAMGALWVLSVLAMTIGNLAALQQRSIKRMLAYSSVAQAGYMLIGVVSAQGDGVAATLFYLISYCAMTVGAFSVLSAVGPDADDLGDVRGLIKRSPFLATCMTLFFLALAGLPPSLAGLMGKVFLFSAALSVDLQGLAIIAGLNSALACAYYFRVPMAMLFQSGTEQGRLAVSYPTIISIGVCALAVVALGLFPEPILGVARSAADALVGYK